MPAGSVNTGFQEWCALVICPHSGLSDLATQALSDAAVRNVVHYFEYPPAYGLASVIAGNNICFLDISSNPALALRLVLRFAALNIPVVTLQADENPELTVQALRKGAIEAIVLPVSVDNFRSMLDRVAARRAYGTQPPNRAGTVYSILSGKGSSGSTTVALNLALNLAEGHKKKVLLVDLDGITGTAAFFLGLKPEFGLQELVSDLGRMDEELWGRLVHHVGPLDVLCATGGPMLQPITPDDIASLIEFWRCGYDLIILDLPGCHSELTIPFARASDSLLLVTTTELATIHSTLKTMTYLGEHGVGSEAIRVIINRHSPSKWSEGSVEAALGCKAFTVIPNSPDVLQKAQLEGKRVAPESEFARSIGRLCARLIGVTEAPQKTGKSPFKALRGLFTI